MKLRHIAFCLVATCAPLSPVAACKLTPAQTAALDTAALQDGAHIGACLISQAMAGNVTIAGLAVACGIPAGFDVAGVVAMLIKDFSTTPSDGGKTGAGLSPSDRARIVAALKAVH